MMILSRKIKESIKTALAMTISYGIALSMGWGEPMWAGFAVAFISLATIGQSLNKAALRMSGTLLAALIALILIALFSQERWLFMVFLSSWVGFCTYMMGGRKNQYLWHVGAFACVIICMDGGVDPINAFDTAMLRTQETGLGILVYSLVAIFIWPINSRAEFAAATCKLASTQQQLYQVYMKLMHSQENVKEAQVLRMQMLQEQNHFQQLLGAAETDSYEVVELRQQWEQYRDKVVELSEAMERWRESFTEVQALDLQNMLPNLTDFSNELDARMTQVNRMLADDAPTRKLQVIEMSPNQDAVNKLSSFHKAAFTVTLLRLQYLEQLTRDLFDSISDIKNYGSASASVVKNHTSVMLFVPDPDRMLAVVRIMVSMWLAYLALIYVSDIPGGPGIVSMIVPIGMALANSPQLPIAKLFVPAITSILFTGLLYIFVMPQLSSFFGLGLLIFFVTFSVCYLFSTPQQMLGRAIGLAIFVAIASISDEQSYSFFVVADTSLMFALVFLILTITAYIPFSPHPERAFLRLLGRFFRSSEYLIATMNVESHRESTTSILRLNHWKKAFYTRELITLPNKLNSWSRFFNYQLLSGTSPEQVQMLTANLQALTYRMQAFLVTGDGIDEEFLGQELINDIQSWQLMVQEAFQRLSDDPTSGNKEKFRARLVEIMTNLEGRIKDTLNKAGEGQLSAQYGENFYRLLGAYRGVSEALIGYTGSTDGIDWSHWHEERF